MKYLIKYSFFTIPVIFTRNFNKPSCHCQTARRICVEKRASRGQPLPNPKWRESQRPPICLGPPTYVDKFWPTANNFGMETHLEGNVFLRVSHAPSIPKGRTARPPIYASIVWHKAKKFCKTVQQGECNVLQGAPRSPP